LAMKPTISRMIPRMIIGVLPDEAGQQLIC